MLYSERDNTTRQCCLDDLSDAPDEYGEENIVYFDESGFEEEVVRPHGWAPIGKKVHGEKSGSKRHRTNLIMAQRGKEWLSPMTFDFACNSSVVNAWLEKMLLPELKKPSIIVMDNASFHKKDEIRQLLEDHGHVLLPLPPYSPDFNPIEESFAVLKKRRTCAETPLTLEQLIVSSFGLE
jgi:transposase